MKHLAAILGLVCLPVLVSCAATMTMEEFDRRFPSSTPLTPGMPQEDDSDTPAARRVAAERYFEVVDLEELVADVVHEKATTLPASEREAFLRNAHEALSIGSFRLGMRDSAVHDYSRAQLVALTQFIETPEGRSAWRKWSRRSGPAEASEGPSDTVEDRRVAAERQLAVLDRRQVYGDIARASAAGLPEPYRGRVLRRAADDYDPTWRVYTDRLTQYFTRREIEALTRFYGSALGQAIFVRTALFMAVMRSDVMIRIEQYSGDPAQLA